MQGMLGDGLGMGQSGLVHQSGAEDAGIYAEDAGIQYMLRMPGDRLGSGQRGLLPQSGAEDAGIDAEDTGRQTAC